MLDQRAKPAHSWGMKRLALTLLVILTLTACGKKAPLDVPAPPPEHELSVTGSR